MISQNLYRDALGRFASGVTIVTVAKDDGKVAGLTASAFSSLSLDPPLVLVCVKKMSAARVALNTSSSFAVHILAENQKDLALAFAKSSEDKGDGVAWTLGSIGTPILEDFLVVLECLKFQEFQGGDHSILIGQVVDIRISDCDRSPMTYYRGELNKLILKE
tara:strand:- start:380 stop:865 length:486 start_codon:yes stop_codon:yes gene_type:complete